MIVVDDGSRQAGEIAALCRRHGAILIRRRSGGPGPARNDGLARVSTGLVAFVDSDCEAGPEWISSLAAHFADPLVAAAPPGPAHHRARLAGRYLAARCSPTSAPGGPGAAADPAVLRADRGPGGPPVCAGPAPRPVAVLPRSGRVLIRPAPSPRALPPRLPSTLAFATARMWTSSGASRKPAGGCATTRRVGQPRGAGNLDPGAGTNFRYGCSAAPLARRHRGRCRR